MRQFLENNLQRAERHVREAERHFERQRMVVRRFELIGNADEIRLARQRLLECEKTIQEARESLRRQAGAKVRSDTHQR